MNRLTPDRAEGLALVLVGAFAFTLIVYPPMVGLADNGDFFRLMYWGKFEYLPQAAEDRYVGWINREFQITKNPLLSWKGYPSSEAIFVKASALLALLWPGDSRFDLRLLGLIHTIGFTAGCWLLLRGGRVGARLHPVVLFAGLILIFCDIGYLAYFHSFYGEPASLTFLLVLVGSGLLLASDDAPPRWLVVVFYSAALLFIVAKPQNLAFALPVALFSTRLVGSHRRIALGAVALIILICTSIYLVIPPAMKQANLYNSTFNGLLKWASAPEAALRELGLDERLAILAGSNYFMHGLPIDTRSEEFRTAFYSRMSPFKVAAYYLRHPAALARAMSTSAQNAYTLQPTPFGNFEKSAGYPFREKATRWTIWSGAKQRHTPRSVWFTAGYLLLLCGSIGAVWWKKEGHVRRLAEFYFVLWLMMVISFVTPVLGDGENDIEKHLFIYNVFFDLSLLLVTGHLLRSASSRLDARRRS